MTLDLRDRIFESLAGQRFRAAVVAAGDGVLAGMSAALAEAGAVGCRVRALVADGALIVDGTRVLELTGVPKGLALAEEVVMGALAKPSGIASATRRLVDCAAARLQIVAGGWKKMPRAMKQTVRQAVQVGGAATRIDQAPFLYLDKNYVRMFGGVAATLDAVAGVKGHRTVIQIGAGPESLEQETRVAVAHEVSTLFVDTGDICDVQRVLATLAELGARDHLRVAFGGGVGCEQVEELARLGVDALCIGRAIVDAPLVDFRMEILEPVQMAADGCAVAPKHR